jgi:hypothetical protein
MHPFRALIESGETDGLVDLFTEDVVFSSPVVFQPYKGREALAVLLHAVMNVFEDFHYEREIGRDGDSDHALVFRARVGDREIQGCDFFHTNADGLIDQFTVMVRPLSATLALAEAMKTQVEVTQRELGIQTLA